MSLRRSTFLLIVMLYASPAAIGQDLPKAELVDEFARLPCGHVHAKTDGFAEDIKRDPGSKAVIVIHPPDIRPEQAERVRRQISSFLQLRNLETEQFIFYKAGRAEDGEIRTQFWKLPAGSQFTPNRAVLWKEEERDTSRSFMFGYEDEINICPTFVPKAFARLILDNRGSRVHIVVRVGENPMENRFYFAARLIKELVQKQGIPRKRLRLFFSKGRESTGAEFWFVPARK